MMIIKHVIKLGLYQVSYEPLADIARAGDDFRVGRVRADVGRCSRSAVSALACRDRRCGVWIATRPPAISFWAGQS